LNPGGAQVSITFDPFMYLTLPLPQTARYRGTVLFVPADPSKAPIRVRVRVIGGDISYFC
jgi:ubiquitin carboxyl-terminal hydrolase 4/11/15